MTTGHRKDLPVRRPTFLILLTLASTGLCGPAITFDRTTYDCGTVYEGKTDTLNAVFIVKSTGDKALRLKRVTPDCGCTVVTYDTLIRPGKIGRIVSRVGINGYPPHELSKYLTVASNARNDSSATLTIRAAIRAVIYVSEHFLNLGEAQRKSPETVYVSAKKNDLTVSSISFRRNEGDQPSLWQGSVPLAVPYKWIPTDSINALGYHVFRLEILSPPLTQTLAGDFIISTNDPDKPDIDIPGIINR